MKKIIGLFVAMSIFGCSSDDNSVNTSSIKLIKAIVTNYPNNDTYTTDLIYAGNNIIKAETIDYKGSMSKNDFIYTNGKLQRINYIDDKGNITDWQEFTYEGDLIHTKNINDNTFSKYDYNTLGQLSTEIQTSTYDESSSTITFEYDIRGNIAKETHSKYSDVISYLYDDKKNPFSLVYSDAVLKALRICNNNVMTKMYDGEALLTFEYKYNSNGYPTEKIEKWLGETQTKTEYFYQ